MPYTKRVPHYSSAKELIEYILDEKNDGEKVAVASSINCNVETALPEFIRTQKRFDMKGNRVCYHIIQSFSPLDNISPEQANEIGKKVCEELYTDYQCVISTHVDRGHIHNHICVNAINLKGKKLEDRLANKKEGLYGLSETSDKIASEYGCFIMPKRTIKTTKGKNYYYKYRSKTWKNRIKENIDNIIYKCSNLEEFLNELSLLGYEIKRGKYISVKCVGMKKFARLNSISPKYSVRELNKYFRINRNIKLQSLKLDKNEFNSSILTSLEESKAAIEKTQMFSKGKEYNEYQKTKYMEIKRFYRLKEQLEFLDKNNIDSFERLENEIEKTRKMIKKCNIKLKKEKENYKNIVDKTEKIQEYIKLRKVYEYAMSYRKIDSSYKMPEEIEVFLELKNELKIETMEEAKKLIIFYKKKRVEINRNKNVILELQKKLNKLDSIKEEKLKKSKLFIHNIKFGSNRIDYNLSDDENFCVNLPYVNEKIFIPKKYVTFNNNYYTLFLVDEKKYELYNKKNKKIKEMSGVRLERYIMDKKKENDYKYRNK